MVGTVSPLDATSGEAHRSAPPELTLVTEPSVADAWTRTLETVPYVDPWRLVYAVVVKRALDIVFASLLIVLFAVPMLAVALWIRRDSHGGAIYTQRRLGYTRREFTMYKFRSMYHDADDILAGRPELTELYGANWKLADDPRVTMSGGFIRRFSIDELPQLFNVLKGDMSIVGPRPYLPRELRDEFGAHADRITSVRPGMTGLWQVSGRSLLSPSDRIALDEAYIHNCGAVYDLRILLRTVRAVVRSQGAY